VGTCEEAMRGTKFMGGCRYEIGIEGRARCGRGRDETRNKYRLEHLFVFFFQNKQTHHSVQRRPLTRRPRRWLQEYACCCCFHLHFLYYHSEEHHTPAFQGVPGPGVPGSVRSCSCAQSLSIDALRKRPEPHCVLGLVRVASRRVVEEA
jgi:hypothetical protein